MVKFAKIRKLQKTKNAKVQFFLIKISNLFANLLIRLR